MAKEEYKSRVYTDRPAYADFDAPAKFQAIQSIIAKRLKLKKSALTAGSFILTIWKKIKGKKYDTRKFI